MRAASLCALCLVAELGCSSAARPDDSPPAIDCGADSDGDGLKDCAEVALGTDMHKPDSDGDGDSDGKEVGCVSNPLDAKQKCYACGWKHDDPGDLVSTGKYQGDVIANMKLVDQCGDSVQLWDFATTLKSPEVRYAQALAPQGTAPAAAKATVKPEYHILLMTAAW